MNILLNYALQFQLQSCPQINLVLLKGAILNLSISTAKTVPVACSFMSMFIGWLSRNGLKNYDSTVFTVCHVGIFLHFNEIFGTYTGCCFNNSEDLLCFAICYTHTPILILAAEPRSNIAGVLFHFQYHCGTILVTPNSMLWDWRNKFETILFPQDMVQDIYISYIGI